MRLIVLLGALLVSACGDGGGEPWTCEAEVPTCPSGTALACDGVGWHSGDRVIGSDADGGDCYACLFAPAPTTCSDVESLCPDAACVPDTGTITQPDGVVRTCDFVGPLPIECD